MGGAEPGRQDVEWLDDERSAGRLRRLLDRRLSSRLAKGSVGVLAAAVATVAVVTWPDSTGAQGADQATVEPQDEPEALSEPLARSIDDASGAERRGALVVWKIVGPVDLSAGPGGHRARVVLVNRGSEPQLPEGLRLTGSFREAPRLQLRARCRPVGHAAAGQALVAPGGRVELSCRDVTGHRGDLPRLARRSLQVVAPDPECESEGRPPPF